MYSLWEQHVREQVLKPFDRGTFGDEHRKLVHIAHRRIVGEAK
jgi:hypothetical protein